MIEEFEYIGKAMGTEYSIAIVCESRALADNMYGIAKNMIEEYESRFSRFLPTSELSTLNETKNMIVSKSFFTVTTRAYELYKETKGVFNPLFSVAKLGYTKDYKQLGNEISQEESQYNIDFSSVLMDSKTRRIQLKENQSLDYGGFLKGYISEIIAQRIKLHSGSILGVIVNIGGDLHTEGLDKDGNKFVFNIYNPVPGGENVSISLYNQSLATSGTYKRTWFKSGEKVHHILDITGKKNPETDVTSSSVIHTDGAISEAYAKVFLSMDYKDALELAKFRSIYYVIIKNDGKIITNYENIS